MSKKYRLSLEVWGDYALFCRPEHGSERVSYDVITPSAARGLVEAIYWHKGLRICIDAIRVLNPIQTVCICRNEISAVFNCKDAYQNLATRSRYLIASKNRQQRTSILLKNPRYVIDLHLEAPAEDIIEHHQILLRRVNRGQCYHQPYLGAREFAANFRKWEGEYACPQSLAGQRDLGLMLFDMDYSEAEKGVIRPQFFRAVMRDGVVDLRGVEVLRNDHS